MLSSINHFGKVAKHSTSYFDANQRIRDPLRHLPRIEALFIEGETERWPKRRGNHRHVRRRRSPQRPTRREWPPFDRLRTEIDRVFEDFGRGSWPTSFFGRSFDDEPFWRRDFSLSGVPAVDIAEKDGAYEITAELPGMEEKDIDIQFSDGMLTIKGEKKEEKEEKKKDYHLSERHFGSFRRSFRVPKGIEPNNITAEFKNGVLSLTLPKSAQAKKKERKIAVKAK